MSDTNDDELQAVRDLALSSLPQWGLQHRSLELIKHRENAVYKLISSDGTPYALRVHRANYHSDASLRSEFQWMQALQSAGICVPEIIPCNNGDLFARVAHPDVQHERQVDLFAWIDGEQLGSVEEGLGDNTQQIEHIYSTIGRIAAQLHNQSSAWARPEGFVRHAWDRDGLVGNEPLWGRFWELAALSDEQRKLLMAARDVVKQELAGLPRTGDCYGLIHADFAPENLLVSGNEVRLIDFDDAGFGWHMFELATALYFIQDDPHFELAKSALLNAYCQARPTEQAILETLPLFMLARSFTYVGWVHTRPGTQTAEELTPALVEMSCGLAEQYLA